jgi:hypothetical protein
MKPASADSEHRLLVAAALQTQQKSERHLQELWPRLRLAQDQHGAASQEYRKVLGALKVEQTLWWENTMMLKSLS